MQLYIIRHAQSINNALWDLDGNGDRRLSDPGLTEAGRQQSQALALYLSQAGPGAPTDVWDPQNAHGFGLTHLYTSLMVRAVATAAPIARALELPMIGHLELHETGGIYQGNPNTESPEGLPGNDRAFFNKHYPDLILPENMDDNGWWNRAFEERAERPTRARRVLGQLLNQHEESDDHVAMISHGGFFNYFMTALLRLPPRHEPIQKDAGLPPNLPSGRWLGMNNAAITRIDFSLDEVRLVYLNRLNYLPLDLIT